MKFIYLALITAFLGLVWRVTVLSGPSGPARPPAAPDVSAGPGSIVMVILKTNTFFAADEHPQEYYGAENSECAACGIPLFPRLEAPDLKR